MTSFGAHNLDAYRGRYLDGVVVDEFSEIPGNSWKGVIYPMLSDYKGWGVIIGTPKGRNQFYHRYRDAEKAKDWDGTTTRPARPASCRRKSSTTS